MEINTRVESDITRFSKKTLEREKFEKEFYNNQFKLKDEYSESAPVTIDPTQNIRTATLPSIREQK